VTRQPGVICVEDRATLETERNVRTGPLESRARSRFGTRAHGHFAERHRADPARDLDRFQGARRRELTEDPPHRLDLRWIGRSDCRRAERKGHAWTLIEADYRGFRRGI
jgi:hypothetical protein